MINDRTRLHVFANGTMTGQRYIDEVLLPHVRLFRGAVGDKFVFMDDNATCHRTLAVQDCLDSEGIQCLVWPERSPDLNPIENVWDALGRQVAGRNYPPTYKNTLIRALTEEWDKLPQKLLDNVVQRLRKYKGKLFYRPVSGYQPKCTSKMVAEPKPKRSKTIDCHLAWSEDNPTAKKEELQEPMFRSKSFGAHDPILDEEADSSVRLLKFSYSSDQLEDPFLTTAPVAIPPSPVENIPHTHCTEDPVEPLQDEQGITKYCPPLDQPVPDDWVVVDDEFVMVYACHQTHLSSDVLFAPEAKMDDGIMWLIVIKAGVSRAQAMYFLASLQTGDHVHIPYVDVIPIHAFRLEPLRDDSYLTVDGEVIPCCNIQAEVLPSMARVMTR
ncbi:hypothetical protein TNCV_3949601 [Trichonephila clavipes]|nr:hypothetical protein TNCV_3949601 [Trichonephila clavipes]